MLVLSRKAGEKINVGSDIVITVTEIGEGRVRLGIEAPQQVSIFRAELRQFLRRVGAAENQCLLATHS